MANMSDRISFINRKYTELETACEVKWNFHNALFFAGTVATTIGYGKLTPETFYGRLWCIFYLSLGIPYFAILTSSLSESLNIKLARFEKKKQRINIKIRMDENFRKTTKTSSEHRQFSPFKFVYFISGVVLILALPTAIFCILEGWTKVFSTF